MPRNEGNVERTLDDDDDFFLVSQLAGWLAEL